jgi:hypothetical protein
MTEKILACENNPATVGTRSELAPHLPAKAGHKPAGIGGPATGGGPRQQVPGERRRLVNAWGMAGSALSKARGPPTGARMGMGDGFGRRKRRRVRHGRASPPSGDAPWRAQPSEPEDAGPTDRSPDRFPAHPLFGSLAGLRPAALGGGWLCSGGLRRTARAATRSGPRTRPGGTMNGPRAGL